MTGKLEIYVGVESAGETATKALTDTATAIDKGWVHPLVNPAFDGWPHFVEIKTGGTETGNCAAAITPRKGNDLLRFLAGCLKRDETALVIHEVSPANPLPDFAGGLHVRALPADVRPTLASKPNVVDKDLALRIRDADVRWFSIGLGKGFEGGAYLHPLLVDALGNPVAAVWLPGAKFKQRWYIIPPGCPWKSISDWLVHRAIPEYVSTAANRVHELAAIEEALLTEEEREAQAALDAFEFSTTKEREAKEAIRVAAKKRADEVRTALLYKSSDDLKQAVATVLDSCGFEVEDLDKAFGDPLSSDLLATREGKHWLIESKWAGGHPSEDEIGSVVKHMRTWEKLGRSEKLEHGVLVLNHHSKRPPPARPATPFQRKEFVATLPDYGVSVISSIALCRWWAAKDCESLISAVTGPPGQHIG